MGLVRKVAIAVRHARQRMRLRGFQLAARARGARLAVDVHPTAYIGKAELTTWPGTSSVLRVGPHSRLEDGSVVVLKGGTLSLGPKVTVRRGAVLNVGGHLDLQGHNLVSWHSVIHCGVSVTFEEFAGTGEGVTVVDGSHFHGAKGAADEHWYGNNTTAPVRIGRNSWLATKSTVAAGAVLGEATTVAGHAFVRGGTYSGGMTLAGVPARVMQEQVSAVPHERAMTLDVRVGDSDRVESLRG